MQKQKRRSKVARPHLFIVLCLLTASVGAAETGPAVPARPAATVQSPQPSTADPPGGQRPGAGEPADRVVYRDTQPGNSRMGPAELPSHTVKVLRTTNKAQTNRYVPKVYRFQHVNPFDVVRFYRRVMEIEEGRLATFLAPDRKSGLVLIIAPEYQIPWLDELMETIDRPGLTTSSGDLRKFIQLKYRAADDLGLVRAIWGNANHSSSQPTNGTRVEDTLVATDLEANAVYLDGPESGVLAGEAVLQQLDRPLPQVLVEATVYEIDLTNDGSIGLDYYSWKNGPGRNLFAVGAFAEYESVSRLKGGQRLLDTGVNTYGLPEHRLHNSGVNAAWFYDMSTAYFDFLVATGKARVITNGRVVSKIPTQYRAVLNAFGQSFFQPGVEQLSLLAAPSEFRALDEVLYYRVANGSSDRAGARPSGYMLDPFGDSADYPDNRTVVSRTTPLRANGTEIAGRTIAAVDVGTLLQVTPRIGVNHILLDLHLEVSSLLGFDGQGEPRISARRADSDIRLRDGEEVVFGGLERVQRIQSTDKMPFLGSLPVLGWAFGGETNSVKKTVVVSVIRASALQTGVPADMEAVMAQVDGLERTNLPPNQFGYDQWLLDQNTQP
jgi:hypothetical protein